MQPPRQKDIDTEYLTKGRQRAEQRGGFNPAMHPVEPGDLVKFAVNNYETNGSRLFSYYGECMDAFLWRYGIHHYRLDNQSGMLVPQARRKEIDRPYLNFVGPEIETIVSRMMRATPEGKVLSGSEDPMDRFGARQADNFLKFKNEKDGIDKKHWIMADIGATCGNSYGAIDIDTADAETIEIPLQVQVPGPDGIMQMQPVIGPDGEPITETIRMADEQFEVLIPIQVILSRGAKSFDKSRVVHTHSFCDYEWARAEFPGDAEEFEDITTPHGAGYFQWRLMDLMRELSATGFSLYFGGSGDHQGETDADRSVQCHTVRIRPDADYPLGRKFSVIGNVCVGAGSLTFGKKDKKATMDIVQYSFSPIAGSAYAMGIAKDLKQPNKWIEGIHYQAALTRRRIMPRWLYPIETGGSFESWANGEISDEPGKALSYDQSAIRNPPNLVMAQGGIDASMKEEIRLFAEDYFGRISGTAGMRGDDSNPYSPGVAMRMRADNAAERLSPKIGDFHSAIEKATTIRLKAIAHAPAWQLPQRVSWPGKVGRRGFMVFSAGDMRDNFRYSIMVEAKNNPDPVTKMQLALDMWDRSIINQIDPKVRLAIIRLAGTPELLDEGGIDVQKAERENAFLEAGIEANPSPWDNHIVELAVHMACIKGDEFQTWPEDAQARMMEHVGHHIQAIEIEKMAQQRTMADMGIEPGGAAAPSGFDHSFSGMPMPGMGQPPGMVGQPGAAAQLPAGGRGRGGGA